jgi:hypothetical protein
MREASKQSGVLFALGGLGGEGLLDMPTSDGILDAGEAGFTEEQMFDSIVRAHLPSRS